MGMYTELILGARLRKDTPKDVIETLRFMVGNIPKPEKLAYEGRNPLSGGSYYFAVHTPVRSMFFDAIADSWTISTRSNIKNYNGEIERFLQWLSPYIESGSGYNEIYALSIYEEDEEYKVYKLHN